MPTKRIKKFAVSAVTLLLLVAVVIGFAPINYAQQSTQHIVTFIDWDNTVLSRQEIAHGEDAVAPLNEPSREGYSFEGWDQSFKGVEQDLTVNAIYRELSTFNVMIRYQLQDGTAVGQPYYATVKEGYTLQDTVTSPSVTGFKPDQPEVVINIENAAEDFTAVVTYLPSGDTPYTVYHYTENLDGESHQLADTEELFAQTGEEVTALAKEYSGFSAPKVMPSAKIASDGSTEIEVYYERNTYTVLYDVDGGSYIESASYLYEEIVDEVGEPTQTGHQFTGWEPQPPTTMPAQDITVVAQWEKNDKASYTLVYWLEDPNSPVDSPSYDFVGSVKEEGKVDSLPQLPENLDQGTPKEIVFPNIGDYDFENYYYFNDEKTEAENVNPVAEDGSTLVNIYYRRHVHVFAFYLHQFNTWPGSTASPRYSNGDYVSLVSPSGEEYISTAKDDAAYQSPTVPSDATDGIYHFSARFGEDVADRWPAFQTRSDLVSESPVPVAQMGFLSRATFILLVTDNPGINVNIIGNTVPGNKVNITIYGNRYEMIPVPVQEMLQDIGGGNNYTPAEEIYNYEIYSVEPGEATTEVVMSQRAGFYSPEPESIKGLYIDDEGNLPVSDVYYDRMQYTLTFYNEDSVENSHDGIWYQESLAEYDYVPTPNAGKSGYTFGGWYSNPLLLDGYEVDLTTATMPIGGLQLYSKWVKQLFNVNFDPQNGEDTFIQQVETGDQAIEPTAPTKAGYEFVGWREPGKQVNYAFTNPVHREIDLVAVWKPLSTIPYTVRYLSVEDGSPVAAEKTVTDQLVASTITEHAAIVDDYLPDVLSKSITLNVTGNEITFHYTPFDTVDYRVHYKAENGDPLAASETKTTDKSVVTENFKYINGYYPNQYQITLPLTSNDSDNFINFFYTKNGDGWYTVNHHFQNLNGISYTKQEPSLSLSSPVGSEASYTPQNYEGFSYNDEISTSSALVTSDGKAVIDLYFDRLDYTVEFAADANGALVGNTKYADILHGTEFGDAVTVPTPKADAGYRFVEWSPSLPADSQAIEQNLTFTATFAYDASQWRRYITTPTAAAAPWQAALPCLKAAVMASKPTGLAEPALPLKGGAHSPTAVPITRRNPALL